MAKSSTIEGRRTMTVRRPPAVLFAAIAHLDRLAWMLPQCEAIDLRTPDLAEGVVGFDWAGLHLRAEAEVEILLRDPPHRLRFEVRSAHLRARGDVEIREAGPGASEVAYRARWTALSRFQRLKRLAMEEWLPRHLDEVTERFRRLLEEPP